MTTGEIADVLQVTIPTVKRWIRDGHLKAFRTAGRHYRVTADELERFKAAHGIPTVGDEPRRVLIIDDDARLLEVLADGFALDPRYKVETAADGYEGLIKIGNFRPHLLVLDVRMPGLDGFEVCRKVRQQVSTRGTRILAITGFAEARVKERILEVGADAFLQKPFTLDDLSGEAARLLGVSGLG